MLQHIIKVNGFEVQKGVCTVEFRTDSKLGNAEQTHADTFRLLATAETVVVLDEMKSNRYVCTMKHGGIYVDLFYTGRTKNE